MQVMPDQVSKAADFKQLEYCQAFLKSINSTDLETAASRMVTLLDGMMLAPPPSQGHLKVLESLRGELDDVLSALSRRYASQPLPPSSKEQGVLHQVVRLWLLMEASYGFVGKQLAPGNISDEFRALLMQRRMSYLTNAIIEFFRARQEIPVNMWRDLHALYQSVARSGLAATRVPDKLNDIWGAQSPLESYVSLLLIDVAGPYGRRPREFSWLVRWSKRFAPYCDLTVPETGTNANSYLLDLEADHGLRPMGAVRSAAQVCALDTGKLAAHIQSVVKKLKSGATPASLGLGGDCVQPACARLLVSLYRPWGKVSAGRRFPRRPTQGKLRLCLDLEGVAFFLLGSRYRLPDEDRIRYLDFHRTERMMALGDQVEQTQVSGAQLELRAEQEGFELESWEVADQSVAGFRLRCNAPAVRVMHRQLVGVLPDQSDRILLADVSWLQYQRDGSLSAGISLLPGPPRSVAVRPQVVSGTAQARERFQLGFMIPEVSALKTEESLVVPAGWFMADRPIEVHDGKVFVVRLVRLLSRGTNFDRVTFVRVGADVSDQNVQ